MVESAATVPGITTNTSAHVEESQIGPRSRQVDVRAPASGARAELGVREACGSRMTAPSSHTTTIQEGNGLFDHVPGRKKILLPIGGAGDETQPKSPRPHELRRRVRGPWDEGWQRPRVISACDGRPDRAPKYVLRRTAAKSYPCTRAEQEQKAVVRLDGPTLVAGRARARRGRSSTASRVSSRTSRPRVAPPPTFTNRAARDEKRVESLIGATSCARRRGRSTCRRGSGRTRSPGFAEPRS